MRQPVEDLLGVGAGGLLGDLRPSHGRQMRAVLFGQIRGYVRAIVVEELAVVTDGPAGFRRLPDIVADRYPCFG